MYLKTKSFLKKTFLHDCIVIICQLSICFNPTMSTVKEQWSSSTNRLMFYLWALLHSAGLERTVALEKKAAVAIVKLYDLSGI